MAQWKQLLDARFLYPLCPLLLDMAMTRGWRRRNTNPPPYPFIGMTIATAISNSAEHEIHHNQLIRSNLNQDHLFESVTSQRGQEQDRQG